MKTYKHFATAIKHGATETVYVDGEPRWAKPGIRPDNAEESRFAVRFGNAVIGGHDRVAFFGNYDGVFVVRVDGLIGGSIVKIFTNEKAGRKAFAEFSARYEADDRWIAR